MLPLWFIAWYNLADLLLWPAITASAPLLNSLHPGLVEGLEGSAAALQVVTGIDVQRPQGVAQIVIEVNALSFAWNLPVLLSLLFATDKRFFSYRHVAVAYIALLPLYVWGICFDVLKTLALQSGYEARAFLDYSASQLELLALGYQFGYLMLPVIGAVAIWLSLNRDMFLLLLGRPEPVADAAGL
jgi:hypothetical protein